jgi:hypothetical protein
VELAKGEQVLKRHSKTTFEIENLKISNKNTFEIGNFKISNKKLFEMGNFIILRIWVLKNKVVVILR